MHTLPLLSRSAAMEGERSLSSASNISNNNEDHEYVWDGFTQQEDQLVATINQDYYEDLELAARLGQTLLQRNKELDTLNYQLLCRNEEQNMEIEHLNKQLAWLRELNESKNRMCEQFDLSYQESESTNRNLRAELRQQKEKLAECMKVSKGRDEQIQSLEAEMELLCKKSGEGTRRRTIDDCCSLVGNDEGTPIGFSGVGRGTEKNNSSTLIDENIRILQEAIGKLKAQQMMDRRLIQELRKELDAASQENQDFCDKLQEEREMTHRLSRIIEEYHKAMYSQAFVAESTPDVTSEILHNGVNFHDHGDEEILDQPQQNEGATSSERVGIKSAFLSQSFRVLMPLSPYLRITSSTPLTSPTTTQDSSLGKGDGSVPPSHSKQHQKSRIKSEPRNISLVQEMDTQYKTLLGKYEMLLQSIESERVASPAEMARSLNKDATAASIVTESSCDEIVNTSRPCSAEASPEYKRLFRELFNMINAAKT